MIRVAWWLGVFSITACAGRLDNKDAFLDGGPPADTADAAACALADIQTELVDAKCASTAGCHLKDQSPAQGLVLTNDDVDGTSLAARLVDVESGFCTGKKFIDSANPGESFIIEKLGSSPSCGLTMPLGQSLPEAEIACMQAWVQSLVGAP